MILDQSINQAKFDLGKRQFVSETLDKIEDPREFISSMNDESIGGGDFGARTSAQREIDDLMDDARGVKEASTNKEIQICENL